MSEIRMSNGSLEITIKRESAQFFGNDLYTMAIVMLIEEADTHGWEKSQREQFGESSAGTQFYSAVLAAVARHASVELAELFDLPSQATVDDVLTMLLDDLRAQGKLQLPVRGEGNDQ